jgi:hypothetical protein
MSEGVTKTEVKEIVKEMIDKKGGKRESRPLTPYQKHMSVCLKKDNATFKGCIDEWNKKKK